MIKLYEKPVWLIGGRDVVEDGPTAAARFGDPAAAHSTMADRVLDAHNVSGRADALQIKFDALASHDITYVSIVQTARASGLTRFPLPYVLTNCHNSLCAVGGTINEDDHMFALSAAQRYGGIYVPPHLAVIHQYIREQLAGCGKMILGSDSHTRYGALGTLAMGEGGGELVKQLLGRTYDLPRPPVVAVYLTNEPRPGVGPQDVALALIGAVFKNGFVKNKILEFIGDGVSKLPVEYRNGIDVMTTETTCLSSLWQTDEAVHQYLALYGREEAYKKLSPGPVVYYPAMIEIDLSKIQPMIALPFHPSNAYTLEEFCARPTELLAQVDEETQAHFPGLAAGLVRKVAKDGGVYGDQGVIGGCAGGSHLNLCAAADILEGRTTGDFPLSLYPASQPVYLHLIQNGAAERLMAAGALLRSAFCGPCFGAGDVPANNGLSLRHATRNFPSREGARPGEGQMAYVALMDARSIAASAANGGRITPAADPDGAHPLGFAPGPYRRVYQGWGRPHPDTPLRFGPNITDWPAMPPLGDHLLLQILCRITDPVTTTDELIPSGETSAYRSNPEKLAEFTLSRRAPGYVAKAKALRQTRSAVRMEGAFPRELAALLAGAGFGPDPARTEMGSALCARKPGDGSAREQAASCQKVLGGWANLAEEYATKRYRSNLINWGVLPFLCPALPEEGTWLFIENIRQALENGGPVLAHTLGPAPGTLELTLGELTEEERAILLAGCLINYYRSQP